jgi:uncharacterized protein (DUF1778 family)
MKDLLKTASPLHVRLTEDQRRLLRRAARIVSRQRGEVVAMSTLLREEAVRGAERIIAATGRVA